MLLPSHLFLILHDIKVGSCLLSILIGRVIPIKFLMNVSNEFLTTTDEISFKCINDWSRFLIESIRSANTISEFSPLRVILDYKLYVDIRRVLLKILT